MAEFLILPPLVIGAIIGFYELILIHRDEHFRGSHWLGHGIHAAIFAIVATFCTMNAEWVYSTFQFLQNVPFLDKVIVFQIAIGLVLMVKVHATSAVVKGTTGSTKGMKETWAHSFVVAALVVLAPYIWPFIAPMLESYGIK
jgi:hypothetical protein